MKNIKILLLMMVFPLGMNAQEEAQPAYEAYPITLCTEVVHEGSFYVYDPPFLAKKIYSKQIEAVNEYPEQLMESIMSANNQEWVYYNTYGGAENTRKKPASFFERAKTQDKDKNYYELLAKFEFEKDGHQYAVLKSYLHLEINGEQQQFPSALLFIKEDGQWYTKRAKPEAKLVYFLANFQIEVVQAVLEDKPSTSSFVNVCKKAMNNNGNMNFNKAPQLLGTLKASKNTTDIKQYLEKTHWPRG